jgi:hypothetical protein
VQSQEAGNNDVIHLSSQGPLEIGSLIAYPATTGLYEKFEISFFLSGEWDNPFDPDQVTVDGHFRAPDGKEITVPGFFYQEYRQSGSNHPQPVGTPVWKVRFTPGLPGEYRYEIIARNKNREVRSKEGSFISVDYGANRGFIRVSTSNPLYFEYDDGKAFFAVAMDKAGGSNQDYERRYRRFTRSGGNFNRLFLTNGNFNIEELNPPPVRPDRGLGKINLEASWNLDQVIGLGETFGVYHILTLTNQWTFNHMWKVHTYNKANGGILDSPEEYYTNEQALRYFRNYLRYVIARWGYSTSVFSWDLWNEYSASPGFDTKKAIEWHQNIARYVSSLDAFHHIIHTDDGKLNGADEMNRLPEMAVIATNSYAVKNIANVAEVWTKRMITRYKKPYILAEFGPGHNAGPGGYAGMDPQRVMVHNGLWSPVMSGSAGTGMAWEGNWLDDKRFYTYLNAVTMITHDIPFNKCPWRPVSVGSFRFDDPKTKAYYGDVIIEGWPGNFGLSAAPQDEFFHILPNGTVDRQEALNAVLTGATSVKGPRNISAVTFKMTYPAKGRFIVHITELRDMSSTPQLTVLLDGRQVIKEDLTGLNRNDKQYPVDMPAGAHTIKIENSGGGSFVTVYEAQDYILRNGPDLEVRGIQSDDYILLWLKNQQFTILHEMMEKVVLPQAPGKLELQQVPDGWWKAEWVNTLNAEHIQTNIVESKNGKLELVTPEIGESVAIRLHRISR